MKWFLGCAAALVLVVGIGGCRAHIGPVGHHHPEWRPVAGHRHDAHCGHYHHKGKWHEHAGHKHGDGCGHHLRDGIWILID